MALDDPQRAKEITEAEQLLGVLNHPGWDNILVPIFRRWLAEATAKTTDVELKVGLRDKAAGLAEAWGKMAQLKQETAARLHELRESEQMETASAARAEEHVGAKAEEQWYEQ